MKKSIIKTMSICIIFTIFTICICFFAFCFLQVREQKSWANHRNFPEDEIKLSQNLYSYTNLKNIESDIHCWGVMKPTAKVKDYNPFNDYWIIGSQEIVVDTFTAAFGGNEIWILNINKVPFQNYSDKICQVSLSPHNSRDNVYYFLNLSNEEISDLEHIMFLDNYNISLDEIDFERTFDDSHEWTVNFHIKDMNGLYYSADYALCGSEDGNYYVAYGETIIAEIPQTIKIHIDKALKEGK